MKSGKKKHFPFLIAFLGLFFCLITAVFVLLFTHIGSAHITKKIFNSLTEHNEISWEKSSGSLISGMVYEHVELRNLEWFSTPNILRVKKITVNMDSPSLSGIFIEINQARLILPDADSIIAFGRLDQGVLDVDLYSRSFSIDQIKPFVMPGILDNMTGDLSELDLFIRGPVSEPRLEGSFIIDRLAQNGFSISKAPAEVALSLKTTPAGYGLYGSLLLSGGTVSGKKTALVTLQKSRITFDGDPFKPSFAINATSRVEKTKLDITVKGTFAEPDLQIKSDPPLSKERAIVALATNKTWAASDKVLEGAPMTPEMTREFLDYFLFSSPGNKFAQRFGLSDLSVKFTETSRGLSASKAILPGLEGTYEIESRQTQASQSNVTQKIGGEFQVTDGLSVEAKKELKQQDPLQGPLERPEDEIYLKYKKTF